MSDMGWMVLAFVALMLVTLGTEALEDSRRAEACYAAAGRAPDPVAAAEKMSCAQIGE